MSGLRSWLARPFDNPVLRREIKLITRRGYFEWVVFVLTVGMTLVIASRGGGNEQRPAYVGQVLFQMFFGIAQALVLVAGPAVAASSIASEREGRTYEALVLTGLAPRQIARGKFLAAMANVGAYVVALAPVGALPFLFGGISAVATLLAFAQLFVVTALAVLLGLAISARLPTTRSALITSVAAGALAALAMHVVFGETVGDAVCASAGVRRAGAIWLPGVLADADISWVQFLGLLFAPLFAAALGGWFLLEVCTASLADASADRTSGLKKWFLVSAMAAMAIGCGAIALADSRLERAYVTIASVGVYLGCGIVVAFVFQGDEVVAPRRVRKEWAARRAGFVRRVLGPGLTSSALLQLLAGGMVILVLGAVGLVSVFAEDWGAPDAPFGVAMAAPPVGVFLLFVVGVSVWLRVRFGTGVARVVLALLLVVLFVAPYAVAAILGGTSGGAPDSVVPLLAAPSPAFTMAMARHVAAGRSSSDEVVATLVVSAAYTLTGILALTAALLAADRQRQARDAEAARMDALIAREDAHGAGHRPPRDAEAATSAGDGSAHAASTRERSQDERFRPPAERLAHAHAAALHTAGDAAISPSGVSPSAHAARAQPRPVDAPDAAGAAHAATLQVPQFEPPAARPAPTATEQFGTVVAVPTPAPAPTDARPQSEPPRASVKTPPHGTVVLPRVEPPKPSAGEPTPSGERSGSEGGGAS